MLNSVLVGFLGQVDLEQHTTKDRKPYEQWQIYQPPTHFIKYFFRVKLICLTTVVKTDLASYIS